MTHLRPSAAVFLALVNRSSFSLRKVMNWNVFSLFLFQINEDTLIELYNRYHHGTMIRMGLRYRATVTIHLTSIEIHTWPNTAQVQSYRKFG